MAPKGRTAKEWRQDIEKRFDRRPNWAIKWAVLDFLRWWVTCDQDYVELVNDKGFDADEMKGFRGRYSVYRETISSEIICQKLSSIVPAGYSKCSWDEKEYIRIWCSLSESIGVRHHPSPASKLLWFYQPHHVALYDSMARASLEARYEGCKVDSLKVRRGEIQSYRNYLIAHQRFVDEVEADFLQVMKSLKVPQQFLRRVVDKYLVLMATDGAAYEGCHAMMDPTHKNWFS